MRKDRREFVETSICHEGRLETFFWHGRCAKPLRMHRRDLASDLQFHRRDCCPTASRSAGSSLAIGAVVDATRWPEPDQNCGPAGRPAEFAEAIVSGRAWGSHGCGFSGAFFRRMEG
jgi:hypothetical protein